MKNPKQSANKKKVNKPTAMSRLMAELRRQADEVRPLED
jgi:hypothetical protein